MLRRCVVQRNLGRGDEYVRKVFDSVSSSYDTMNDIMSLGVHRLWKDHFVSHSIRPRVGGRYLDVAGGTGDIAFRIADRVRALGGSLAVPGEGLGLDVTPAPGVVPLTSAVVVLDINAKMLAEGRQRALRDGYDAPSTSLQWELGSGEALPFADGVFDSYSVAFGIRNFSNRLQGLKEAHRVLKVGGVLNVLEFSSNVTCPLVSIPYNLWSDLAIPALGGAISGDRESYQYLVDSIRSFPDQETFAALIGEAGFGFVRYENLSSGIACIHTAVKIGA